MPGVALPYPWIDGLTKRQQTQIYEDFRALANAQRHSGHRPVTLVVAPSDASIAGRRAADYIANGSNDAAILQAAVTELSATGGGGGNIRILEGTLNLGAVTITVDTSNSSIHISGNGSRSSIITSSHASRTILTSGGGVLELSDVAVVNSSGTGAAVETTTSNTIIHDCYLEGFRGFFGNYGVSGQGARIYDNRVLVSGTDSRGIQGFGGAGEYFVDNKVEVVGAGVGIRNNMSGLGFSGQAYIAGNDVFQAVKASGSIGIYLGWNFFDETTNCSIHNNRVSSFDTGIMIDGGDGFTVLSNHVMGCTIGIDTGPIGSNTSIFNGAIMNNSVHGTTGATAHIRLRKFNSGNTYNVTIAFNKCHGTGPANAIVIGSGVTNAGVFFNDTYEGYSSAAVSDSGTSTRREIDMLGSAASALLPVGGSAGFVLAKASGANYDATWIRDQVLDLISAKGDLVAGTAADTAAVLTAGRNDTLLQPDSSLTKGLKWGPKLTVSPTAPASPEVGDIWIDTT